MSGQQNFNEITDPLLSSLEKEQFEFIRSVIRFLISCFSALADAKSLIEILSSNVLRVASIVHRPVSLINTNQPPSYSIGRFGYSKGSNITRHLNQNLMGN
ncbi:MAG: hypothetical protein ACXADH_07590 [Candidatus Kariarchaeaceae archaeon]